ELDVGGRELRMPGDRQLDHRVPVGGGRQLRARLVGRRGGGRGEQHVGAAAFGCPAIASSTIACRSAAGASCALGLCGGAGAVTKSTRSSPSASSTSSASSRCP